MPYDTGDVLWAPDPYHEDDPHLLTGAARPWVVLSTPRYPAQGEDYLCCALTSTGQRHASLVPLGDDDWEYGRAPRPSSLDPMTVMTVKHAWVTKTVGRLAMPKVNRARNAVKGFL